MMATMIIQSTVLLELKKTIEDEEDRRETTPFPLLTPLKYCYLVLTLGTLLGLPVSTFTATLYIFLNQKTSRPT